jgi:hypothetical protein
VFNLILAAVGVHILAVVAYQVVKGHDLIGPMLTGRKRLPPGQAAAPISSPVLAGGVLAATVLAVWGITRLG